MITWIRRRGVEEQLDDWLAAAETPCQDCAAAGLIQSAAWLAWCQRYDQLAETAAATRTAAGYDEHIPATLPALGAMPEYEPDDCPPEVIAAERAERDHLNTKPNEPEQWPCTACDGSGLALTPAGQALVDLLTRHGLVREVTGP